MCEFNCIYCYGKECSTSLNSSTLKGLISEANALGVKSVRFIGGDPLLREDLFDLILYAKNRGMEVFLYMASARANEGAYESIVGKVDYVMLSLDGVGAAHDEIKGLASFEACLGNARALRKLGAKVIFSFTATRINAKEFMGCAKLAEEIGASLNVYPFAPCGNGGWMEEISMTPHQFNNLLNDMVKSRKALVNFPCGAGRWLCAVDCDGSVTPCSFHPAKIGSVKEHGLREIWYGGSEILKLFRNPEWLLGKCGICGIREGCFGGCRAVAYRYYDTITAPDPQCWNRIFGVGPYDGGVK